MRSCCRECFTHAWLRAYVERESHGRGRCSYCYAHGGPLIRIDKLCWLFENLARRYTRREESIDRLIDLVQMSYEVFSDRLFGDDGERAVGLLNEILVTGWDDDDGEDPVDAAEYYSTRPDEFHETQADMWAEFVDRVKQDPTETPPLTAIFGDDLARAEAILPVGALFWRARAGFNDYGDGRREAYGVPQIGPPPPEMTEDMRASKRGEVVLYCTDDKETAIAELRPATGYILSIGRFRTTRELRIVDLTRSIEINPFVEESLAWFEEFSELLDAFGEQLAKPLERADDKSEYVPCQKIAEAIRDANYDGIRYPSAMHPDGANVVFFDPAALEHVDSTLERTTAVTVEHEAYNGIP